MGEVGCLFGEIAYLVEPSARRPMCGPAGPRRGTMPEPRGQSRASGSPMPAAEVLQSAQAASADERPGMQCRAALCVNGPARRRTWDVKRFWVSQTRDQTAECVEDAKKWVEETV